MFDDLLSNDNANPNSKSKTVSGTRNRRDLVQIPTESDESTSDLSTKLDNLVDTILYNDHNNYLADLIITSMKDYIDIEGINKHIMEMIVKKRKIMDDCMDGIFGIFLGKLDMLLLGINDFTFCA